MLRTNRDRLIEIAVHGEIYPPELRAPYRIDADGRATLLPGMAGVVYNARVGQSAYHWVGDHVEPCVSIKNREIGAEQALHYLSCVGNEAVVTSGRAAGARGVVTGEHDKIMVDMPEEALPLLCVGDQVQVRAYGTGLELLDYPGIAVRKVSPRLLDAMNIREPGDGRIQVPVAAIVPPYLMGSGMELGADYVDQDIMTNDEPTVRELGLDRLRVGDIVAVQDHDHTINRGYKRGAVVVGLVNHANSFYLGHGPGCMALLACSEPLIEPVVADRANIADYLGIGTQRGG